MQWHPAFVAAIREEFEKEYPEILEIIPKYDLFGKPVQINISTIVKQDDVEIENPIGKVFRKYNIIQYKSPNDYLTIHDYYKCMGYVYFYEALSYKINVIKIDEFTLSMVCTKYPKKMIEYLEKKEKVEVAKYQQGIYYIKGSILPIQLIVINELEDTANYSLLIFSNNEKFEKGMAKLLEKYNDNPENKNIRSLIEMAIRGNTQRSVKVMKMSNTLKKEDWEELDRALGLNLLEKARQEGIEKGIEKGIEEAIMTILMKKFEIVPLKIKEKIGEENDIDKLNIILMNAFLAKDIEQFIRSLE